MDFRRDYRMGGETSLLSGGSLPEGEKTANMPRETLLFSYAD
jgi:hypothetical protein